MSDTELERLRAETERLQRIIDLCKGLDPPTFFITDLVERLRYLGDHASFEPSAHHDAADEIERLRGVLRTIVGLCDGFDPPASLAAGIARAALAEQGEK